MRYEHQGLDKYANTDPSRHFNQVESTRGQMTWQRVWIYLLQTRDEESAQLVKDQNRTLSMECEFGDHEDCHYPNCECGHHRATVFKKEHEAVKSCKEVISEQEARVA